MKPFYDYDGITLYNCDCADLIESVDYNFVLTDPPYGISRDKGFKDRVDKHRGKFEGATKTRKYNFSWDNSRPQKEIFDILTKKKSIIFGGNYFSDLLPSSNHWVVWDKLNTMPTFSDCELIWTNIKRNSVKKITVEWNGLIGKESTRFHPTQKPLKLIKTLLEQYHKKEESVFDPFCGSGTTLLACKQMRIKCIGIEIEKSLCEKIIERLSQDVFNF